MSRAALTLALLLITYGCGAEECRGLRFEQTWIRQPPPGAAVAAGYFRAVNETTRAIAITGFTSPEFASVMVHRTDYVEGRSTMRHLPELAIPGGATFDASPGGAHLMLGGAGRQLDGDLVLEFAAHCGDGSSLPVWFTVRRSPPLD